jgi:hypothetical protein
VRSLYGPYHILTVRSLRPSLILCRALDDIDKQSQALLGKGRAAQILDKAQDSGIVANLIEQLRRAILLYQVGYSTVLDRDRAELTS